MKTLKEDFKGTPGEWKIKFFIDIMMKDFVGDHNGYTMEMRMADAKLMVQSKKVVEVLEMAHLKIKTEISLNALLQQIPEMDLQQALDDDEILKAIESVLDEAL